MQLGNGHWETASFNNRLEVTQLGLGTTNADQNLLKLEFSYSTPNQSDNNGSMREQKITVPMVGSNPGFTAIQSYVYDSLSRIQSATETVSGSQTWKETFNYDRYGNRQFDTNNNNTTTLAGCLSSVCNPTINTTNNRFSSGQNYLYDADGDVIQDAQGQRFGYDSENRQNAFFAVGNNTTTPDATYFYDGEGRRVKKISSGETTVFVYDASGQLAAEYSTQIETVNPQVSYLTTDHLGSPRIVTDQNGAVTSRKDFAAFGDEITSPQRVGGTNGNGYNPPNVRQDYTGYQKDGESGLEYSVARYYNPSHGRYTSVDPQPSSASTDNPQSFNRYSYVLNSPYEFIDPLGLAVTWCGPEHGRCDDPGDYDTVPDLVPLQHVIAKSMDKNGNPVDLTKQDRKALQKSLRKLVPGTVVQKNGAILVPQQGQDPTPSQRLLNGIANTGRNVTVIVNHAGKNQTYTASQYRMRDHLTYIDSDALRGEAVDSVVMWDPNRIVTEEERVGPDQTQSAPTDPAIALAHELIHAYNYARKFPRIETWHLLPDETIAIKHYFTEGGVAYYETADYDEFRAVGFAGGLPGDVTENQIRAQLGLRSRATYRDRADWKPAN